MVNFHDILNSEVKIYLQDRSKRGIVPNENDIGNLLDHITEREERKAKKDLISVEDLEKVVDKITDKLLSQDIIYRRGDWKSYHRLVRSKNLISVEELNYMRMLAYTKNKISIRDTEFPLDKDGKYIEIREDSPDSYSTSLNGRSEDSLFIDEVESYSEEE